MKKNRLFIILVVLTVLTFLATAASCNFCGISVSPDTTEGTDEPTEEETTARSTSAQYRDNGNGPGEDEEPPDEEPPDEEPPDEEPPDEEPPAEEPPDEEPPGEEPPEEEPPGEEPPDEPIVEGGGEGIVFTCDANLNRSGYVTESGSLLTRTVFVGDATNGDAVKGFISFDIRELRDTDIVGASITISGIETVNDPSFADQMIIKVYDFGELDADDFDTGGVHLASISIEGLSSINISSGNLKTLIEQKVGEGKDYFQIKLGLDTYSNDDTITDFFLINPSNAVLIVEQ